LGITDLGLIVIGDEFKKHGIIADGTNSQRFPEIFQRKRDKDEFEGSNYEGALVGIEKTGLFEPLYKADFSSMYPTIVAEFNLSPDTTTLLEYRPLDEFKIEETDNWFEYHIPDRVLGKNMVIQVSKNKSGFCAELVKRFLKERAEFKKLAKETGDKKYKAMSDNRKVKANGGVYGIQGAPNHAFGFAPIGIATTGIGRQCGKLLIDVLNQLYPLSVVEYDTDGVYFTTSSFNQQDIINLFNQKLRERFKKDLAMFIDIDSYDGGYFYKTKNYVLRKGEKIIYHGASLKASSKDLLSKNLIQELTKAKLTKQPVDKIIQKYQTLDFPLEYFAMNVILGMGMKQYKNINALAPRLAKQAEKHFGLKPEVGMQLYYVKTTSDYKLLELSKKEEIDTTYYRNEIDRVISMFDIEPAYQTIDKWI
jgi:DNA polymerase elongation subunit (family B)